MNTYILESPLFDDDFLFFDDDISPIIEATESIWTRLKRWLSSIIDKIFKREKESIKNPTEYDMNAKIPYDIQTAEKQLKKIKRLNKVLLASVATLVTTIAIIHKKNSGKIKTAKSAIDKYNSVVEQNKSLVADNEALQYENDKQVVDITNLKFTNNQLYQHNTRLKKRDERYKKLVGQLEKYGHKVNYIVPNTAEEEVAVDNILKEIENDTQILKDELEITKEMNFKQNPARALIPLRTRMKAELSTAVEIYEKYDKLANTKQTERVHRVVAEAVKLNASTLQKWIVETFKYVK